MDFNKQILEGSCRLCAETITGDRRYIFSQDEEDLIEKINSCLPISVRKTDPLPKQICINCHEAFDQYIIFFYKVLEAEKKLKNLWRQTQITEKKEGPCIDCPLCLEGSMGLKEGRVILGPTRKNSKDGQKALGHIDNECLMQMIRQELEVIKKEPEDPTIIFEESATYLCYKCKKYFSTEEGFAGHDCNRDSSDTETEKKEKPKFNHEGPAVCEHCGKEYKTFKRLKDHISFCHPKTYHYCDLCNTRFAKKWLLTTHMRKHTGENPYRCEICGKEFPSSSYLWNHNNSHHAQRNLKCGTCEATGFYTKQDLENHIRTKHTKERIFHCTECDKSFMSSGVFYQHRYIHTNIRKYSCSQCKKSFRRWQTLRNHERIHTGERPFSCDVCGRAFRQKGDMKKHRVTQHGNGS